MPTNPIAAPAATMVTTPKRYVKIFVVARDDAKAILKDKNNSEFKYIIDYCKRAVDQEDIIKA